MVNNIKLKLSKHLLCGFLSQRMQDVEEMTLRFSNFYSFMWLVTVLSYVAFGNLAPARFGQEGTRGHFVDPETFPKSCFYLCQVCCGISVVFSP